MNLTLENATQLGSDKPSVRERKPYTRNPLNRSLTTLTDLALRFSRVVSSHDGCERSVAVLNSPALPADARLVPRLGSLRAINPATAADIGTTLIVPATPGIMIQGAKLAP